MGALRSNKKVAAGLGIAAVAAAVAALGTGTFAAFTDSSTPSSGIIAAGTFHLAIGGNASTAFDAANIAPTATIPSKTVVFANDGSIDGILTGKLTPTDMVDGGSDGAVLQDQLEITSSCSADGGVQAGLPFTTVSAVGDNLLGSPALVIPGGGSATCVFNFTLPARDDNNVAQGDKVTLTSSFTLTQKTS